MFLARPKRRKAVEWFPAILVLRDPACLFYSRLGAGWGLGTLTHCGCPRTCRGQWKSSTKVPTSERRRISNATVKILTGEGCFKDALALTQKGFSMGASTRTFAK